MIDRWEAVEADQGVKSPEAQTLLYFTVPKNAEKLVSYLSNWLTNLIKLTN